MPYFMQIGDGGRSTIPCRKPNLFWEVIGREIHALSRVEMGKAEMTISQRPPKKRVPMPLWMRNRREVTGFLGKLFPKLKTDARQQEQSQRWRLIIEQYFTGKISSCNIAARWDCRPEAVTRLIQRIRLAAANRRQSDGKPRLTKVAPDLSVEAPKVIFLSNPEDYED